MTSNNIFKHLKNDIPASIVVFLVAVPLCLGIALASGAPLFSGIIAGIVGGIVVGSLSGSRLGVSGPAAGLAAIVLAAINQLGAFETFLLAVVIAGIFQLILGFMKAGFIAYYFPSSVIKGMLSGIGVIIILKQIPHAFGYDKSPEGDLAFNQMDGENTFSAIMNVFDYITPGAIVIALISMALLVLWEQNFIKKLKVSTIVQGPLVVVALGVVLGLVFQGTQFGLSAEQLVSIPMAADFASLMNLLTFPDYSQITNPEVYVVAATIAAVASIETLLSVEATDKLDPQKNVTPTNQELKAQGVGNVISGMIGGLPLTQVIIRSSANIQSGGKTKMSAIIHGFMLLTCALAIPAILNMIPLASLAAILFLVGYKLARPSLFIKMYKAGKTQFVPFVVTILGIVFTDLLTGIAMGMVVSVFFILYSSYKAPYFFDPEKHEEGKPFVLEFSQHVTFLNKGSILQTLNHIPADSEVIIDTSRTIDIDPDVMEIIEDFKQQAITKNIQLKVTKLNTGINRKAVKDLGTNPILKNGQKKLESV